MQPRISAKQVARQHALEVQSSARLCVGDERSAPSRYRRFQFVSNIARSILGRKLVRRSYYLGCLYYQLLYLSRALVGTTPLLIYQMGKVGSSTLWHSLAPFDLGRPAFRVHALQSHRLDRMLDGVHLSPRQYYEQRSDNNLVGRYLNREWQRVCGSDRWKVITLVRDPLAQSVSSFFQVLDLQAPEYLRRYERGELEIEELVGRFMSQYTPSRKLDGWFKGELHKVFGLNVFESPFDCDAGYSIYRAAHADILLIRLEDLDRCGETVMREFLGIKGFKVIRGNVGKDKDYGELYLTFRKQAVLPADFVRAMYCTDYARHFYAPEELESFASRWSVTPST